MAPHHARACLPQLSPFSIFFFFFSRIKKKKKIEANRNRTREKNISSENIYDSFFFFFKLSLLWEKCTIAPIILYFRWLAASPTLKWTVVCTVQQCWHFVNRMDRRSQRAVYHRNKQNRTSNDQHTLSLYVKLWALLYLSLLYPYESWFLSFFRCNNHFFLSI